MLIAYHTASPGDDPDEALEQVESIEVCMMEGTPANPTISCPASSNAEWLVYHENGSGVLSTIKTSWIKNTGDPKMGLYAEDGSAITFPYLWADNSEVAFFLKVSYKDGSQVAGQNAITELGGCSGFKVRSGASSNKYRVVNAGNYEPYGLDLCVDGAKAHWRSKDTDSYVNVCWDDDVSEHLASWYDGLDSSTSDRMQASLSPSLHVWRNGQDGSGGYLPRWISVVPNAAAGQAGSSSIRLYPSHGARRIDPSASSFISTWNRAAEALGNANHEFFHAFQSTVDRELGNTRWVGSAFIESLADVYRTHPCIAGLDGASGGLVACTSPGKLGTTMAGDREFNMPFRGDWSYGAYKGATFFLYLAQLYSFSGLSEIPAEPEKTEDQRFSDEGFDFIGLLYQAWASVEDTQIASSFSVMDELLQETLGRPLRDVLEDYHTAKYLKEYTETQPEWAFQWVTSNGYNEPIHFADFKPLAVTRDTNDGPGFPCATDVSGRKICDRYRRALRELDSWATSSNPPNLDLMPRTETRSSQQSLSVYPYGSFGAAVAPDSSWQGASMRVQAQLFGAADLKMRLFRVLRKSNGDLIPQLICGSGTALCKLERDEATGVRYLDQLVDITSETEEVLLVGSAGSQGGVYSFSFGDLKPSVKISSPSKSTKAHIGHPEAGRRAFLLTAAITDDDGRRVPIASASDLTIEILGCARSNCTLNESAYQMFPVLGPEVLITVTVPSNFYPSLSEGDDGLLSVKLSYRGEESDTASDCLKYSADPPSLATVFALDKSGSMLQYDGMKLDAMKLVARSLVNSLAPAGGEPSESQVALVSFDHEAYTLADMTELDDVGLSDLDDAIADINSEDGGTSIGDALLESQDILAEFDGSSSAPDTQLLIVVSDGINEHDSPVSAYIDNLDPGSVPTEDATGSWANSPLNYQLRKQAELPLPQLGAVGIGQNADLKALDSLTRLSKAQPILVTGPEEVSGISGGGFKKMSVDFANGFGAALGEGIGFSRIKGEAISGQEDDEIIIRSDGTSTAAHTSSFFVEDGVRELRVVVTGHESASGLLKAPPNGLGIQPTSTTNDQRGRTYRIVDPPAGTWTFTSTANASAEPDVFVEATVDSPFVLFAQASPTARQGYTGRHALAGTPVQLVALPHELGLVQGCSMVGKVDHPDGSVYSITWRDDGRHGDGEADDGIYGRLYTATGTPGIYSVSLSAHCSSPSTGSEIYREKRMGFVVVPPSAEEDVDNDGIPDLHETGCLDPSRNDAAEDADGDGLSNLEEFRIGTDPCRSDSDGGGESDHSEYYGLQDPNDASDDGTLTPPLDAIAGNANVVLESRMQVGVGLLQLQKAATAVGPWSQVSGASWSAAGKWQDFDVNNGDEVCYRLRLVAVDSALSGWSAVRCVTPQADPFAPTLDSGSDHGVCGYDFFVPKISVEDESNIFHGLHEEFDLGTVSTGVEAYRYWFDSQEPPSVWKEFHGIPQVALPSADAQSLTFEFRDGAGNSSTTSLNLTCTEPSCPLEPSSVACCAEVWNCPGFREFAVFSSQSLKLGDEVHIKQLNGQAASVANAGTGQLFLGVAASVKDAWSAGGAFLADRSIVRGDLTVEGQLVRQNQTQVLGALRVGNAELIFPKLAEFKVPFPQSFGADLHLEPNQTSTLLPASRRVVHLKAGAKLRLSPGAYYFDELFLEPNSQITYSSAHGPVYIYVKSAFTQRGHFLDDTSRQDRLLIGYFGEQTAWIESPLAGTLVAPHGKVQLRNLNGAIHQGAVVAKVVEFDGRAKFAHVPFAAPWLGGAVAGVEWRGERSDQDLSGCNHTAQALPVSRGVWLGLAGGLVLVLFRRRTARLRH